MHMTWITIIFLLILSIGLIRLSNSMKRAEREEAEERAQLANAAYAYDAAFHAWLAAETARLSRDIDALARPFEEWEAQERMKTIDLVAIDLDKTGGRK
jgi:type II secretory pathway pseudopilin PulG